MLSYETTIPFKAIKQNINKSDSPIKEVIANALDANADEIYINIYKRHIKTEIGIETEIKYIEVIDNGTGIDINKFEEVFCKYRVSNKKEDKTKYGKRGVGRFVYLKLTNFECSNIEILTKWENKIYKITYSCEENRPINFTLNDCSNTETFDFSTKVLFKNVFIENLNTIEEIENYIIDEIIVYFADVLTNKKIYVNNKQINIKDYLIEKKEDNLTIEDVEFNVLYYFWNNKVKLSADRQKHIQFLDENNQLKGIKPSGKDKILFFSKKYPHTIIVKSKFFNEFENLEEIFVEGDEILNKLLRQIKAKLEEYIIEIYKENITEVTEEYVRYLKNNIANELEYNVYSTLMFPIANKLVQQRRLKEDIKQLIANLIKVLINENPAIFIQNLNLILGYSTEYQYLLHYVEENYGVLKALTEKDKLITKLDFLKRFEEMVYGENSHKIKERTQLHLIVEKNLWIIDERFESFTIENIFSDVSIKTIIKKHFPEILLHNELDNLKIKNINKIPDIVIPLKEENNLFIIELKKPGVKVDDKIIYDVKNKYIDTLDEISRIANRTYKLHAYVISDDKDKRTAPTGNLESMGFYIEPVTWFELINETRERYKRKIGEIELQLKNSKWANLQDFIDSFSKRIK